MNNAFENFLNRIVSCLKECDLEFVLVGGATLPYYGNTRTTEDIDIMINIELDSDDQLIKFVECLNKKDISITISEIIEVYQKGQHITGFDINTWLYRLDLKRIYTNFDRLTLKYKIEVDLYGLKIPISCPESLIAIKLSDGFSTPHDLEDALSVIEINNLDLEKLKECCNEINSLNNLKKFLNELNTEIGNKILYFLLQEDPLH